MASVKITKREVDGLKPADRDRFLWDRDVRGFGLKVTPAGTKTYVLQYRMGGRESRTRRYTIGKHGSPWTPDLARDEAKRLLMHVGQGRDPVDAEKERRRKAVTLAFGDYADRFVDAYLKGNWPDTWREGKRILDVNVKPVWGSRPLTSIRKGDVAELLDGFRDRPAMKKNTHSVLRKLFKWAASRDDISGSPLAEMEAPKSVPSRKRVLNREELVCVWLAAEKLSYPWRGVVRLLIATLQRREEVAALDWRELTDLEGDRAVWELPPERAKNDEGHRVPLNALALAEISRLPRQARGLLFTTTGRTPVSGFSKAKARLDSLALDIMRERATQRGENPEEVELAHWRIHDLRRTGTTMMQGLDIPIEVTEAVINHISGSTAGVAGVYNRFKYEPQKRRALDLWSGHLSTILAEDPSARLVAFSNGQLT